MDLRPVFYICGILLSILAVAMLIPAAVDLASGVPDWSVFAGSAGTTLFVGLSLILANRMPIRQITVRQAFVFTVVAWVVTVAFAALPFRFSHLSRSYVDAFFEAMSGLTTTGATVMTGLDHAPPGILLWRGLLNGLGGVGIVVMAVAVLPFLRIGGMQIFRMESSDKSEKVLPKVTQVAGAIIAVYVGLILLCAVSLLLAGMGPLDAFVHAMAAVATGGFSTKDASVGYFNRPAYEGILVVFMLAGALPLTWYIQGFRRGWRALLADSQVVTFLSLAAFLVAVATVWLWRHSTYGLEHSFRLSVFNVVSILTDTGFASTDYSRWGHFAIAFFLILSLIGGCTGSTAGAIKIFRWQLLFRYLKAQFKLMYQPHRVIPLKYNGAAYSFDVVLSAIAFIAAYLLAMALLVLLVCLTGVDFLSSFSGVAACMANSGPGLGPIVGPAGTFEPLPDAAKWLLSFAMLLGRLEIFTVVVLLTPSFWRD